MAFFILKFQLTTKGKTMTKVSYTANGQAKVFYFDFPFFQKDDIRVAIDGKTNATGFAIQIGKPNPTATFPYTGGSVHFGTAPKAGTVIDIWRHFVMERPCDYQALGHAEADDLNRDFNFNLENMKDFRRQLVEFSQKYDSLNNIDILMAKIDAAIKSIESYGEITNLVTKTELTSEISQVIKEIQTLDAKTVTLSDQITDIQESNQSIEDKITKLENRPAGETVIRNETNYTDENGNLCSTYIETDTEILASGITGTNFKNGWYKKNKLTNWLVQGGFSATTNTSDGVRVNLPLSMREITYTLVTGVMTAWVTPGDTFAVSENRASRTVNSFNMRGTYTTANATALWTNSFDWMVSGFAE